MILTPYEGQREHVCKQQFGWLVQTPANISDTQKNYIYPPAGGAITWANNYNSHTVYRTFKNLASPDSLNGAESLCNDHVHFPLESFFSQKTGKSTFSNSSLGFCPICMKLGTYTLQLDLI